MVNVIGFPSFLFGELSSFEQAHTGALALLAEIYQHLAAWRARQGRNASQEIAQGLTMVDKALATRPQDARALARRGALHLERAQAAASPPERAASLAEAEEALAQALTANRNLTREFGPALEAVRRMRSAATRLTRP